MYCSRLFQAVAKIKINSSKQNVDEARSSSLLRRNPPVLYIIIRETVKLSRDNANRRILVSHKSSRGFEPGSLVTGCKQVVHWTSETW
jgi:hypothetical protein